MSIAMIHAKALIMDVVGRVEEIFNQRTQTQQR